MFQQIALLVVELDRRHKLQNRVQIASGRPIQGGQPLAGELDRLAMLLLWDLAPPG